ncbi:MAG TPA: hypothetical protein DEA38_10210 [Stenotrophomonas sp.]|nr:hypothetical protein [Stenotrophomonas sp.]
MGKLVTVQWLRGLAAIGVVWFHAMFLVVDNGLHSYQTEYGQIRFIGAIGVDVFFVISGFIISVSAARNPSIGDFLRNRFLRIWPLYAVATLAYLMIRPERYDLLGLGMSLVFLQPPGGTDVSPVLPPGWTLLFEAAFYAVVVAALLWRSQRLLQERIAILLAALVMVGCSYGLVRPLNIVGNPIVIEFLMGVLIGRTYSLGYRIPGWAATSLFAVGAFLILRDAMHGTSSTWMAETTLDGSLSWPRVGTWGLFSAMIVASAALRQPVAEGVGRVLTFLGDASYSIYLFHVHVVDWLFPRVSMLGPLDPDLIILIATAAAVATGILAHLILERPLLRVVSMWKKRPTPIQA